MNPQKPRATITKFGQEAITAIMGGVRLLAESVAGTLGPKGRNVLIEEVWGAMTILHDGVRVANSFAPKDEWERAGVKVMQEAALKQRDAVGDGTTVVVILTLAIIEEVLKATSGGHNPMTLRKELEHGAQKVIEAIQALSTPVTTLAQKTQIATISCQDQDLGTLIAETIHTIGDHGVFTVEESKAAQTTVELQDGMQIDKGYVDYFMITDPERMCAILEDTAVLVTDLPLTDLVSISAFLNTVIQPNTKKCLFIAPEIGGDFLSAMLGARQRGQFLGVGVRAPGIGQNQTDILMDIAALTGATFVSAKSGMRFDEMVTIEGADGTPKRQCKLPFEVLGHANRVVASKLSTVISGGAGTKQAIVDRIAFINGQLKDLDLSDFDREQLKGRLAKLTNGVAVIKVGGQTEVEMKERKERALDAVAATQVACKSGMVPGGEIIYLSALGVLDADILGEKILQDALVKPFKRLVENAGYDGGEKVAQMHDENISGIRNTGGFDVTDGTFKDMIQAGIMDPTAVPICAIQTAVSVSIAISSLGSATVFENQA